jgi:hypothetical protein
MTPLDSLYAHCQTGLAVCAAFWLWHAIRYWVHLLRVATDQELVFDFNRICRKQTRQCRIEAHYDHSNA